MIILPSGCDGTSNGRGGARPFEMIPRPPIHKIPASHRARPFGSPAAEIYTQQRNKNARQDDTS
jgi:hypothetical protein